MHSSRKFPMSVRATAGATGTAAVRLARTLLAALLFIAHSAVAQVALVQSTGLFETGNGSSVTSPVFATAPKAGDTIVVLAWSEASATLLGSAPTISVTDSKVNAYTANAQATQNPSLFNSGNAAAVLSARVTATGSNFAVTVNATLNFLATDQISAVAMEYSGVGAVDQSKQATGTSSTATINTAAATSVGQELVVAAIGILSASSSNLGSISPSSGYTLSAAALNNTTMAAGAGATALAATQAVQSTTWTSAVSLTSWAAAIVTYLPVALNIPDHFAISDAGTAVNCQASPVIITAHTATHAPVATTGTITVSTSTGHGDWSLTAGGGAFAPGAANSGTATYTYVTADVGAVTLSLKDTHAETVTINVADGAITQTSGSALASEQPTLTFAPSGFRITNGANAATTIGTQVAGQTSTTSLALQAVRTDTNTGACTNVFASGTTVYVSLGFQCNNPLTCVSGQTFTVTNNGTSTGIASNPATGVSNYTTVPLKFSTANAEAPITLDYSDVGQVTLAAKYIIPLGSGAGSGNVMYGTGQFVVQPAGFTLTSIKATASGTANPAASTASGTVFLAAGQPFSATVTAVNYAGNATPNFGQETSPATVTLTPTLVLPASGDDPAISGGFGAFSAGVAGGTAFSWTEAGIMTITPGTSNYLATGNVVGAATGNVGRFIPNGFAVALNTPLFATACTTGAFTYVGQPFTYAVAPVLTVTAQALGGATTQNYAGTLFRLSNASLTGRTYTPTPSSPGLTLTGLPATTTDPAIVATGLGTGTLTFNAGSGIAFTRGGAVAPFSANIALAINVIDLDGVIATNPVNPVTFGATSGIQFSTGSSQYYGRLFLRDSLGSELLDLPIPLVTQYYLNSTQGFGTNSNDSCTTAAAIAFSNYQLNLSSGQTCVRDSGNPGVSGQGCAVAASSRYSPTAAAAAFNLILGAPGTGHSGALTITATAPAWLQYLWNAGSGMNSNPTGLATFGVFNGSPSRIYQREAY